jgi:hypothetical protein
MHGWRVDTTTCDVWFDLQGGYNDNASSMITPSNTLGRIADNSDGSGDKLGATNTAYYALSQYTRNFGFSTFNDMASARRRCN